MSESIFSQEFLKDHLPENHLSTIVGLLKKRDIIRNWADSFKTNKIDYFKEEEVKSRFIMDIFGDVLGFNYRNSGVWLSREEVKTDTDATKPDAALGVFRTTPGAIINEVDIVIEIKGSGIDLDKDQNRPGFKLTPVEQAFLYAHKMGGRCKWVVVSNFREIRFYHHSDIKRYQSYRITDLTNEDYLKEFLFLFHKDQWTNEFQSVTDKLYLLRSKPELPGGRTNHILDRLYQSLHKFEGLEFIDPNFIANLKPFNVLSDYVWHYKHNVLYTLNNEIYDLIARISYNGFEPTPDPTLEQELKSAEVTDYLMKLRYVFNRLRQFLITKLVAFKGIDPAQLEQNADQLRKYRNSLFITDHEHISLKIQLQDDAPCNCINCVYRSLDFKRMIRITKSAKRNNQLSPKELAYAHYQLSSDNYKECYDIYKQAEEEAKGIENKNIEYFLTKINLSFLYNLVSDHDDDNSEILQYIKQIDLDKSLHQELDVYVDEDVRRYLVRVKEFQLFNKIEKKIAELLDEIKHKFEIFEHNGSYSGQDHVGQLIHQYQLLYSHFHKNYLIYDAFYDFRKAITRVFEGLLVSYRTKNYGITEFYEFFLTEAALYIHPKNLNDLLKDMGDLKVVPEDLDVFVSKAIAFLSSQSDIYQFGSVANLEVKAQLTNHNFKEKFQNIFSNIFILLSHLEITKDQALRFIKPIISFLKTEDYLAAFNLQHLGKYLERYGDVFARHEVMELLSLSINGISPGSTKYRSLIASLCKQYKLVSPDKPVAEQSLIRRAVANQRDDYGRYDFRDQLVLYPILDRIGQQYLKAEIFAELARDFQGYSYTDLLDHGMVTWDEGEWFTKLTEQMAAGMWGTDPVFDGENYHFNNPNAVNFLCYYHNCGVPIKQVNISAFKEITPFFSWGLNPEEFDYTQFDARWLLVFQSKQFMIRLAKIPAVNECLRKYLKNRPNSELGACYIQYFL